MQINKDFIGVNYPNKTFIKLNNVTYKSTDPKYIWINKMMIVALEESKEGTHITLFNKTYNIVVKETVEEILKQI